MTLNPGRADLAFGEVGFLSAVWELGWAAEAGRGFSAKESRWFVEPGSAGVECSRFRFLNELRSMQCY